MLAYHLRYLLRVAYVKLMTLVIAGGLTKKR